MSIGKILGRRKAASGNTAEPDAKLTKKRRMGIGTRLALGTFIMAAVLFGAYAFTFSYFASSLIRSQAEEELSAKNRAIINMLQVFHYEVENGMKRSMNMLGELFPGRFTLDPATTVTVSGRATPALRSGGNMVNNDFSVLDRFTSLTGIRATVFVRADGDFVRISTSLTNEKGERPTGTLLDRAHGAYSSLLGGEEYSGIATLFGRRYFTKYAPIFDDSKNVIGAFYIGLDFTEDIQIVRRELLGMRFAETGGFYVLDGSPGQDYGMVIIDPTREGQNIAGLRDIDGREIIRMFLEQKNGLIEYTSSEEGRRGKKRIAAFNDFPVLQWVIVGSTFSDEISRDIVNLRNLFGLVAMLAVAVLGGIIFVYIRSVVTRPLARAVRIAQTIASGDLTDRIESQSNDEVGQLMQAMSDMNQSLYRSISQVRTSADAIATASAQIAAGNQDLSVRTEQQASSLEETASSMEEITSTVRQNGDNARQANQFSASAASMASKGGESSAQVERMMDEINQSSVKIVDIISVIDGIAFQTNILALNAAVEAARAGEQGRGFAVVATEVRNLAQRSASAAQEIKTLIDDSVHKVETGTRFVNEASENMREIVTGIQRVNEIMSEITSATVEQVQGIEQVNLAVTEMDTVSQQNAALVEQAAAAAESLQTQARTLVEVASQFRLSTDAQANTDARSASGVAAANPVRTPAKPVVLRRPALQAPKRPEAPARGTHSSGDDGSWEEF